MGLSTSSPLVCATNSSHRSICPTRLARTQKKLIIRCSLRSVCKTRKKGTMISATEVQGVSLTLLRPWTSIETNGQHLSSLFFWQEACHRTQKPSRFDRQKNSENSENCFVVRERTFQPVQTGSANRSQFCKRNRQKRNPGSGTKPNWNR